MESFTTTGRDDGRYTINNQWAIDDDTEHDPLGVADGADAGRALHAALLAGLADHHGPAREFAAELEALLDEPALLPPQPFAPWLQPGHFTADDMIGWGGGMNLTVADLDSRVEDGHHLLGVYRGHTFGDPPQPDDDVLWVRVDQCRHSYACLPCSADVGAQQRAEVHRQREYWAHWSPAAHDRFATIDIDDNTFTATSEIPAWLRTATAGQLAPPEAPALQVARCYGTVDWPHLIAEHPSDVTVQAQYGIAPSWDTIRAAWAAVVAAGYEPCLDVDIEIDVDVDADLLINPTALTVSAADRRADPALTDTLSLLLPECPIDDDSTSGGGCAQTWLWCSG